MIDRFVFRWMVAACASLGFAACTDLPTEPAATGDMVVRGVTLADWTAGGYGTPEADAAIDRIALDGANTLTLIVTAYQSGLDASTVVMDAARTPTQAAVAAAVQSARAATFNGLRVSIKPHVDVYDGAWRGNISPGDPDAWFTSYESFILEWAAFAEALSVEQFVVGTELAGTLEHEGRWRDLIARARAVFSGELVYAASWDEASIVPFWDALDCVGVNFYAPVAYRRETGRFEALSNWQPWLERLRILHKLAGRDVLITEIGYRSVDGAGMHPYEFEQGEVVDVEEQAHLYWAALQALGDKPWVRGVYWWNWLIGASPQTELRDYTPKGKPAEGELRDAWLR